MKTHRMLDELRRLTKGFLHPNHNPLLEKIRHIDALSLSVKYFGYELARALADSLPKGEPPPPRPVGLHSKPSTQSDLESDWVRTWCHELKIPVIFHRKIWELCYVMQALHENGFLEPGSRGLGFGCGEEPLPSYFASRGMHVTVTDLDPKHPGSAGWLSSAQHATQLAKAHKDYLVDAATFAEQCDFRYVDMNDIQDDLVGFDFCWSICALEHLGSIERGLAFIERSLATLRPGGIAVHTTEFNFLNDNKTMDNWSTVLFQRKHFQEIKRRLEEAGYIIAPLDFDVGSKPLDRFIDIPPYPHDQSEYVSTMWGRDSAHIKLSINGFASTCFGLIIRKRDSEAPGELT